MAVLAFFPGPGIASLQPSLDGLLQRCQALSLLRSHRALGLPEDRLTKTNLTQGQGAISAKRWDISS
jgi:hypothetical protein